VISNSKIRRVIIGITVFAGGLPYYRAMPCNRAELHTLLSRYQETTDRTQRRREML
jgi:hypothetical protein